MLKQLRDKTGGPQPIQDSSLSDITNPEIEAYCSRVSDSATGVRAQLEEYTRGNVQMPQMIIGNLAGSFLQFLISMSGARRVLEVGCFTGYSALAMAEALPPDGQVISLDIDENTNRIARDYWAKSKHGGKIRSIIGDARLTLASVTGKFDLILIDADKLSYRFYFDTCLGLLNERGAIVLDNSLMGGGVLDREGADESTRAIAKFNDYIAERTDLRKVLVPLRDGLLLVMPK